MRIFCVGNSHVNTFSGEEILTRQFKKDIFSGQDIGAAVAYNFYEHHLERSLEVFKELGADNSSYWSLVVGEVDCRYHLPLQADNQKRTDESVVSECVERLFKSYIFLKDKGISPIVFSIHPTTTEGHSMENLERPIYGSWERRNNICLLWNKCCEDLSLAKDIPFISFYQYLVDGNNKTKMEYFLDYCHLNSKKVMPFILGGLNKSGLENI